MNKTKVYYQPVYYFDDGSNIGYGSFPDELSSFEAFATEEDCKEWLKSNGYNPYDFVIFEYKNDDIEDVTIIDADGEIVEVNKQ